MDIPGRPGRYRAPGIIWRNGEEPRGWKGLPVRVPRVDGQGRHCLVRCLGKGEAICWTPDRLSYIVQIHPNPYEAHRESGGTVSCARVSCLYAFARQKQLVSSQQRWDTRAMGGNVRSRSTTCRDDNTPRFALGPRCASQGLCWLSGVSKAVPCRPLTQAHIWRPPSATPTRENLSVAMLTDEEANEYGNRPSDFVCCHTC
jgi:hypothetical protein